MMLQNDAGMDPQQLVSAWLNLIPPLAAQHSLSPHRSPSDPSSDSDASRGTIGTDYEEDSHSVPHHLPRARLLGQHYHGHVYDHRHDGLYDPDRIIGSESPWFKSLMPEHPDNYGDAPLGQSPAHSLPQASSVSPAEAPPPAPNTPSYAAALSSVPRKRSHPSTLPRTSSVVTATSDVRLKRRQLLRQTPSAHYTSGPAPASSPRPPHVTAFLNRFWPANFETSCVPWTPDTAALLHAHGYSAFEFPAHTRTPALAGADEARALELVAWCIDLHRVLCDCSIKVKDEAAWSEPVKHLLSTLPPARESRLPSLPARAGPSPQHQLVLIDATTKATAKTVLPAYPTVKLDLLLAFQPEHESLRALSDRVLLRNVRVNAFADPAIAETLVVAGVEVKAAGGAEGEAAAEWQLLVWASKTLEVARQLRAQEGEPGGMNADLAVGIAVRGHSWAVYVAYWEEVGKIAMYGPVAVAGTDTLYGVFKVLAFVGALQKWAVEEALPVWKERVVGAVERAEREGGVVEGVDE